MLVRNRELLLPLWRFLIKHYEKVFRNSDGVGIYCVCRCCSPSYALNELFNWLDAVTGNKK